MESNPTVQKCKAVPKRKLSHNELLMEKGNSWLLSSHDRSKGNLRDYQSVENDGVVKFSKNNKCKVKGYEKLTNGKFTAKQHRQAHQITIDLKIIEPLELLYIDLCGPSTIEILNKKRYILVIVDDFSRFTWVYFLLQKSGPAQVMIDFIKHIELSLCKKVRKIKSEHGSEFKNQVLYSELKDNLSKFQSIANEGIFLGYSHNSVAYKVLNKRTRKIEETFNLTFDDYHVKQVEKPFVQKPIISETAIESEINNSFDFDYDLIFGVPDRVIDAEIHAEDNRIPKASKHSDDSTLTHENDDSYSTSNTQCHVDSHPVLQGDQLEGEHLNSTINVEGDHGSSSTDVEGECPISNTNVKGEHYQSNPIVEGEQNGILPYDSNIHTDVFHDIPDNVSNVGEGLEPDDMFEDAPLDFNPSYPPLDKWTRNHPKEQVLGDPQAGVETRSQLRAKNEKRKQLRALDDIDWIVAMQSELAKFERNKVWRLVPKPNEVLKQERRAWYATLTNFLKQSKFEQGSVDPTLFRKKVRNHFMLVQIYVDEIIFGSTNPTLSSEFENMMKSRFKVIMMRKINNFLGLNIHQIIEGIFINQVKYSRHLLVKFGMKNNSKLHIPMVVGTCLGHALDKPIFALTLYKSMISSLLYLTASRLDIMFVVCNCARYQSNPREPHLTAIKNIFPYLKGIILLGIWYPSKTVFFVQAFLDADLGGCQLDRKSTTSGC
ncbi:uncharacterized protein LOC111901200 [Lactuca sativa]|uniref:uncharacterized protein LOC111901200 n=1 Tax=Lactuca sativa TaxID=4236 RepID=UPI0022AEB182|nr:uncharacterized protein LOC111901200 [Lactuca sativa]